MGRIAGAWVAAVLGVIMIIVLAAALYYYSTRLAGGVPEGELSMRRFLGFAVTGLVIGGVESFFLCRVLR